MKTIDSNIQTAQNHYSKYIHRKGEFGTSIELPNIEAH